MIPLSDLLNPVDECPSSFKRSGSQPDLADSGGFTKHLSSDSPYRHDDAMNMEYFAIPDHDAQRLPEPTPSSCSSDTVTIPGFICYGFQGDGTPARSRVWVEPTSQPLLASSRQNMEEDPIRLSARSALPLPSKFRVVRAPSDGEDIDFVSNRTFRPSSVVPIPTPLSYSVRKEHEKRYSTQRAVYRCTDCDWAGTKDVERRLHSWKNHALSLTALLNSAPPFALRPSSSSPTTPACSSASDTDASQSPIVSAPGVKVEEFEPPLSRPLDERTCPICRTVVSRRHDLKRHMRRHDPNAQKFRCPEEGCDYANLQKSNLKLHIWTVHRREKVYELARRTPSRASYIQRDTDHIELEKKHEFDWSRLREDPTLSLLHLSLDESLPKDTTRTPKKKCSSPVPSVPCPECGKVMNRQADLKRHMSIHNKDAQSDLKCEVEGCHYSTCQATRFKIHMDGHSGNRPYSCPGCSFRTSDPASLLRHRKRKHGYVPTRRRGPALNNVDELSG